jgi:hypothetical protein
VEDGAATAEDYWDAEEGDQLAGLVYRARDDRADADDTADRGAAQSSARDDHDPQDDEPAPPASPAEFDDDAPPFATAPFAAVPRLNRVRSTPTPPADEEA